MNRSCRHEKPRGSHAGRRRPTLLLALASLLLPSCWDVNYFATFGNGGAVRENGTAVGPVAGFGSVTVGGAVFSEDNTTTVVDDV